MSEVTYVRFHVGGRVMLLTPQQYSRAVKRQKELADQSRKVSRECRYEGPQSHRNTFGLAGTSHGDVGGREETNNVASWKASKTRRIHDEFNRKFDVKG